MATHSAAGVGAARTTWMASIDRRLLGVVAAGGAGSVLALVSSVPMPRGPVTSVEALAAMTLSITVGAVLGLLVRTRWAFLIAPIAYVVTYELSRLGMAGATFGPPRFDSMYGIVAFVVGRGFHWILALAPLLLGIGVGAKLRHGVALRAWVPTGVGAVLVAGLGVLVAWPASTPPVLGVGGSPMPGSIAALEKVEIGSTEQGVLIRAADPDNPVLLYLSGGPGQSDLGFGRVLLEPLVQDFVVVIWDQRGNGTSYPALADTSSVTLEQAVTDTVELSRYLAERFDEEGIYLLGESWGSTLGVLAVEQAPELFHAYIGSGQMVSQRVTDQIIWRDLLAHADAAGEPELYDQVLTLGEPPYDDVPWSNSVVMGHYPLLETPYTPPAEYVQRGTASNIGPYGILASEYSFVDKVNALRGLIDTFSLLYPQLQEIDFRADVPALEVPVYLLDGAHELSARRDLALEWYDALDAPTKERITYEDAGHSVVFEAVDDFRRLMVDEIVPATYGS